MTNLQKRMQTKKLKKLKIDVALKSLESKGMKFSLYFFCVLFYNLIVKEKRCNMIVDVQKENLALLKEEYKFIKECL